MTSSPPGLPNTPIPSHLWESWSEEWLPPLRSEPGVAWEHILHFVVSAQNATLSKVNFQKLTNVMSKYTETLMGKRPLGWWFSLQLLVEASFPPSSCPFQSKVSPQRLRSPSSEGPFSSIAAQLALLMRPWGASSRLPMQLSPWLLIATRHQSFRVLITICSISLFSTPWSLCSETRYFLLSGCSSF